jgi:hypothetical protein
MRINSLKSTAKSTFDEYKGWLLLFFFLYVLWAFRGLFSSVGNTVGSAAEAATAKLRDAAQSAADKQKVKVSGGTSKGDVTDEQAAQYKSDAVSLAHMLGHDSFGVATIFKDRDGAFTLLKRSYSRLNLYKNYPCRWSKDPKSGKPVIVNTTLTNGDKAETVTSIKNATNWKVLVPFYKDATNGRDLLSDLRSDLDIFAYRPYIKWII